MPGLASEPLGHQGSEPGPPKPQNGPPSGLGNMSFPLTMLVESTIHKAYGELSNLAELLQGKEDMHRKMEIISFVIRTRRSFVRLIALVKWAQQVNKTSTCMDIVDFMDNQSGMFTDTADRLYSLAHDFLRHARLPTFAVPTAIDVLTTGSYPDLPRAIKDRYVPQEPLSEENRAETITRLNQVIKCRLVQCELPTQITDFQIAKGIVSFEVPNEFKVDLTIRGDSAETPWTLLRVQIFVEDCTSNDDRNLVHYEHLQFIHSLCQSRLYKNEKPICDLYSCLHSFCSSLQLEVLFAQTNKLINHKWKQYIVIEKYEEGSKLVISYWKDQDKDYTITIQVNERDSSDVLEIIHNPTLSSCSIKEVMQASNVDHINIERLLMDTIQCRTRARLEKLEYQLRRRVEVPVNPIVTEDGTRLIVPLLVPGEVSERLDVSIDPQTGELMPLLPGAAEKDLDDLIETFQRNHENLSDVINTLRYTLAKARCVRAASAHLVAPVERIRLLPDSQQLLDAFPHYQLFKFSRYVTYFLLVELYDDPEHHGRICRQYHMLNIHLADVKEDLYDINCHVTLNSNPLDQFSEFQIGVKRARDMQQPEWMDADAELSHVIAMCDLRIPFVTLSDTLREAGIAYTGILDKSISSTYEIRLLEFPFPPDSDLPTVAQQSLRDAFLSLTFRLSCVKDMRAVTAVRPNIMFWMVEVLLEANPAIVAALASSNANGQTVAHSVEKNCVRINFTFESKHSQDLAESMQKMDPLAMFTQEWALVVHLHDMALQLTDPHETASIQGQYQLTEYDYKRIVIGYGEQNAHGQFSSLCVVQWVEKEDQNGQKIPLVKARFGEVGNNFAANPHSIAQMQVEANLNQSRNLVETISQIVRGYKLVRLLGTLSVACVVGVIPEPGRARNIQAARQAFTVLCQSPCHYRLLYRGQYCIEFLMVDNETVLVRDASLSKFSNTKILSNWHPITGLLALFSAFGSPVQPIIGEQFLSTDHDFEAKTLPEGVVWASNNGGLFNIEIVKQVFASRPVSLGNVLGAGVDDQFSISPLEEYLAAVYLFDFTRAHVKHETLKQNPQIKIHRSPDATFRFNTQFISFVLSINVKMRKLDLQCMPLNEQVQPFLQQSDLVVLSTYFMKKVAGPPFRTNAVKSFIAIISEPISLLKDCINIFNREVGHSQFMTNDMRPVMTMCLTVPPSPLNVPLAIGHQAVLKLTQNNQVITLFFIQFHSSSNTITVPIKCVHEQNNSIRPELYQNFINQNNQEYLPYARHLQTINNYLQSLPPQRFQNQSGGNCSFFLALKNVMDNYQMSPS